MSPASSFRQSEVGDKRSLVPRPDEGARGERRGALLGLFVRAVLRSWRVRRGREVRPPGGPAR